MDNVYVRAEDLDKWIRRNLPDNQDLYSVNDLLGAIETLDEEVESLREKLEDLEQDIEDNYVPRRRSDYTGDSYDDRF